MCCSGIHDGLVELDDGACLAFVEFTLDGELTFCGQSLDVLRHLIEIYVQSYAEHTLLSLDLLI